MSKVKYRVREFFPTGQQSLGSHSFYAESVISNEIDNAELAKKIAARTGFKAYECQAVVAAIADITAEEVLESNRITLANEQGMKMVSIYPKVSGSITDEEVQANPEKYEGATVAQEKFLTPDRLKWTLGATIGINFSQEFAFHKHAQKVEVVTAEAPTPSEPDGDDAVAAPTISGTTPFETSTSVTMSGPTGAEIRYTTDGSTPTSSSSLYSSAITLSATTTVKAIAIKDGVSSEVTTKVFTKSSGGRDAD